MKKNRIATGWGWTDPPQSRARKSVLDNEREARTCGIPSLGWSTEREPDRYEEAPKKPRAFMIQSKGGYWVGLALEHRHDKRVGGVACFRRDGRTHDARGITLGNTEDIPLAELFDELLLCGLPRARVILSQFRAMTVGAVKGDKARDAYRESLSDRALVDAHNAACRARKAKSHD